jgi:hypothetical protein
MHAFEVTQIADDFVDRDVPDDQINSGKMLRLLHLMMVDIQINPFWDKNKDWLIPILSSSFITWEATETWKKSPNKDSRLFAYAYREICEQVVTMTANVIGGMEHARKVIREMHEFYHIEHQDGEDFEFWDKQEGG